LGLSGGLGYLLDSVSTTRLVAFSIPYVGVCFIGAASYLLWSCTPCDKSALPECERCSMGCDSESSWQ